MSLPLLSIMAAAGPAAGSPNTKIRLEPFIDWPITRLSHGFWKICFPQSSRPAILTPT
jgi:hypothetical protein